jgi:hypothetical protein
MSLPVSAGTGVRRGEGVRRCKCHDEPMLWRSIGRRGYRWRCRVKRRIAQTRANNRYRETYNGYFRQWSSNLKGRLRRRRAVILKQLEALCSPEIPRT